MKRNHIIVLLALILVTSLLVLGDFLALFGSRQSLNLDLVQVDFKTVNEETGDPVFDAHARCFQHRNHDACTQVKGAVPEIVSIRVPVQKIVTRSWLFEQDVQEVETADPNLRIMFIHQDYASPVETFKISELSQLPDEPITITMPKSVYKSGADPETP